MTPSFDITRNMDTDPTNKNRSFDWLRQECHLIQSRRFHIFDSLSDDDLVYTCAQGPVTLGGDYADFLREFGRAHLFTDHGDSPVVAVYPLKEFRRHICENGGSYVGFGYRSYQSVFFDEAVICSGGQSKVYVVNKKNAKEIAPSFSDWLTDAYDWAKSKYSPSRWKKIVNGPTPFCSEEMQVVEARRHFTWRHVGFAEDGDAVFEIENQSSRTIPYLTVGIRGKQGKILLGAVWLDVGQVKPGSKALVKKGCYKDRIPADQLEPFDLPEPIPEKQEMYWEFGKPR